MTLPTKPDTKLERDKALTLAMGLTWHEWVKENTTIYGKHRLTGEPEYIGHGYECACGFRRLNRENWFIGDAAELSHLCKNPDFSTWEWFGKLWDWAEQHSWWVEFALMVSFRNPMFSGLINPDRFADAVYAYLVRKVDDE